MVNPRYLKNKFHEAVKESTGNGNDRNVYTFQMLQALRDMAKADVYPDWKFSDQDCNVWSMFHRV